MAPGVKTVNQQHLRGVTTASGQTIPTSASIQLLGIQKSRSLPGQVQFATRGLVAPQRNINAPTVKIATPISAGNKLRTFNPKTELNHLNFTMTNSFHTTTSTKHYQRYTADRYVSGLIVTPATSSYSFKQCNFINNNSRSSYCQQ